MKKRKRYFILFALILVVVVVKLIDFEKNKNMNAIAMKNMTKEEKSLILDGKRIVLDPGHGGNDVGARGQNGTIEKEVTLDTVNRIKALLEQAGVDVILTRDHDTYVELKDRAAISKKKKADLFISIHYDAFETNDVNGMSSYFHHQRDKEITQLIHNFILKQDIGMRDRGASYGDFYVLRENKVPAVLLELGYISNAEDEARINSEAFQEKVATGIVDGIIHYFTE